LKPWHGLPAGHGGIAARPKAFDFELEHSSQTKILKLGRVARIQIDYY
jgi:hypothetical protein